MVVALKEGLLEVDGVDRAKKVARSFALVEGGRPRLGEVVVDGKEALCLVGLHHLLAVVEQLEWVEHRCLGEVLEARLQTEYVVCSSEHSDCLQPGPSLQFTARAKVIVRSIYFGASFIEK